jgi:flagellar motor switch protein FliN/FliY
MAEGSPPGPPLDLDWEQALSEQAAPVGSDKAPTVRPASGPADPGMTTEGAPNLSLLLDIPLEITAELGRTRMIINDLLQLGQGSVIELNKLAGEPLEILVNQKLIARGEVVVVNEKFGIRLTDIISPVERIKQLG